MIDAEGPSRDLRVLALPAEAAREVDPFTFLLTSSLAAHGLSVQPFTTRRLVTGRWDILHVHWPEFVLPRRSRLAFAWRAATFVLGIQWARWRGTRVVWTVHNLKPHEQDFPSKRLSDWFWRAFPRQVDCFISMTRVGVAAIHDRYPVLRGRRHAVIQRGLCTGEYPDDIEQPEARRRLGLAEEATVYCFLGLIRRYKEVPSLIRAFREVPDDNSRLVVAGQAHDAELALEVERAAAGDDRVIVHLGLVPAPEVQLYMRSADLVVLPYADVFNSGAALLALMFHRPILVPDVPTFRELRDDVGPPWVRLYHGPMSGRSLQDAMAVQLTAERAPLGMFDWDEAAARTIELYHGCLAGSDGGRPR